MMQAYALTLARAGYTVHSFDFEGHGRHRDPMSGDVTSLDGTTRLLMKQTGQVIAYARQGKEPVALLGHSMATDILVRTAAEVEDVGPIVLLSAFSLAITPEFPKDLLLIVGAWEPGMTDFALKAAGMVQPDAGFGDLAQDEGIRRRAMLAPYAEHVAILHSRDGQRAALDWLNESYARTSTTAVPPTGWALLALLAAITALAAPLARIWPTNPEPPEAIQARDFTLIALLPAVVAPLVAVPIKTGFLPVLVADYLAMHLLVFGIIQLALLRRKNRLTGKVRPVAAILLVVWALGAFGYALDRYGANFWPTGDRVWIIAALSVGTLPFMLADSLVCATAPVWQRIAARLAFLASLAIAIVLDFERLFFLAMIAPVILSFWLTIGTMGRAFSKQAGPLSAGLALGLVLAWALGVSFPLFKA